MLSNKAVTGSGGGFSAPEQSSEFGSDHPRTRATPDIVLENAGEVKATGEEQGAVQKRQTTFGGGATLSHAACLMQPRSFLHALFMVPRISIIRHILRHC